MPLITRFFLFFFFFYFCKKISMEQEVWLKKKSLRRAKSSIRFAMGVACRRKMAALRDRCVSLSIPFSSPKISLRSKYDSNALDVNFSRTRGRIREGARSSKFFKYLANFCEKFSLLRPSYQSSFPFSRSSDEPT